ncbi:tRNA (adenosine(37)-N6)-threonylcarbamoyltransferase complex dimerization subunit type 1 TsaB [Aeromicrobium sp.]|nr:tRNA (adenosine(37)-N6)-threonylcarbamoyltransferase complex dimerization subunit type 1 TsaB [Candidatus Saccharibacteria bacterium]
MLIITIRTDKPEAEIGLYSNSEQLAYHTWEAHRQLAETLHMTLEQLLKDNYRNLHDIEGIVAFKGPGSFTGLRIGITVANALAYSLSIPIVSNEDPEWLQAGITRLLCGETESIAMPEYGALPHITAQKK